jgi:hypothetical protein
MKVSIFGNATEKGTESIYYDALVVFDNLLHHLSPVLQKLQHGRRFQQDFVITIMLVESLFDGPTRKSLY